MTLLYSAVIPPDWVSRAAPWGNSTVSREGRSSTVRQVRMSPTRRTVGLRNRDEPRMGDNLSRRRLAKGQRAGPLPAACKVGLVGHIHPRDPRGLRDLRVGQGTARAFLVFVPPRERLHISQ